MALNMQDQYLRAERQPPSLIALGVRLKAHYGVGAQAFGIKGNEYHNDGFHRSRAFLLDSPQGNGGDYSTRGSLNQGGNSNNNCAFDFTPGVWGTPDNRRLMIELTKRVRDAAVARDPRLASYYEFAGTLDGRNVVTFYADGGGFKSPFDSSHLDHLHGSKYRSRADNDDSGLADVLLGVKMEEEDMGNGYGPQVMPADADRFTMTVPPVGGTEVVPGPPEVYANLLMDLYGGEAYFRIFILDGVGGAKPANGTDGLYTVRSGRVVSFALPKGSRGISFMRWGHDPVAGLVNPTVKNADGSPKYPDAYVNREPVSVAFEVKQ